MKESPKNNWMFNRWFLKKYHLFVVLLLLTIYQHSLFYINTALTILNAYTTGQLDKFGSIDNAGELISVTSKFLPPFWLTTILLILFLGILLLVVFFTRNFIQSSFSVSPFLR